MLSAPVLFFFLATHCSFRNANERDSIRMPRFRSECMLFFIFLKRLCGVLTCMRLNIDMAYAMIPAPPPAVDESAAPATNARQSCFHAWQRCRRHERHRKASQSRVCKQRRFLTAGRDNTVPMRVTQYLLTTYATPACTSCPGPNKLAMTIHADHICITSAHYPHEA
eukprot:748192-Rhodomonas_salina.1